MKIIVGLGNPGREYERSRHNIGFMAVDELARQILPVKKTVWRENKKSKNLTLEIPDRDLMLVKPQTMMNASGMAVAKILGYKDTRILGDLIVVHDDLDLPLGKIKIVKGRGSAGHKGVKSIIDNLQGNDFWRVRCGIGRPGKTGKWQMGRGKEIEKKFGEWKKHQGFNRCRYLTLNRYAIQAYLTALTSNLKRMMLLTSQETKITHYALVPTPV